MATQKLSTEARAYFQKQGRKGGKIGGKKRMAAMTEAEKKALAHKAVAAREAKRKKVSL